MPLSHGVRWKLLEAVTSGPRALQPITGYNSLKELGTLHGAKLAVASSVVILLSSFWS